MTSTVKVETQQQIKARSTVTQQFWSVFPQKEFLRLLGVVCAVRSPKELFIRTVGEVWTLLHVGCAMDYVIEACPPSASRVWGDLRVLVSLPVLKPPGKAEDIADMLELLDRTLKRLRFVVGSSPELAVSTALHGGYFLVQRTRMFVLRLAPSYVDSRRSAGVLAIRPSVLDAFSRRTKEAMEDPAKASVLDVAAAVCEYLRLPTENILGRPLAAHPEFQDEEVRKAEAFRQSVLQKADEEALRLACATRRQEKDREKSEAEARVQARLQKAALRIQCVMRGKLAREKVKPIQVTRQTKLDDEARIQRTNARLARPVSPRGWFVRQKVRQEADAKQKEIERAADPVVRKREAAATRIQSVQRGRKAKKEYVELKAIETRTFRMF